MAGFRDRLTPCATSPWFGIWYSGKSIMKSRSARSPSSAVGGNQSPFINAPAALVERIAAGRGNPTTARGWRFINTQDGMLPACRVNLGGLSAMSIQPTMRDPANPFVPGAMAAIWSPNANEVLRVAAA